MYSLVLSDLPSIRVVSIVSFPCDVFYEIERNLISLSFIIINC